MTYATLEAIAVALRESQPGDVVIVHAERCAQRSDDESECTCAPITLTVGPKA